MTAQRNLDRRDFMLSAVATAAIPGSLTACLGNEPSTPTAIGEPLERRQLLVFNRDRFVCGQSERNRFCLCHACFYSIRNIIRDGFDSPFLSPFVTNAEARTALSRLNYSIRHHAIRRPNTSIFEDAFEFLGRIKAYDRGYGRGELCLTKENHRHQVRLFMVFLAGGAFDIVEIGPWPYPHSEHLETELLEHERLLAELEQLD